MAEGSRMKAETSWEAAAGVQTHCSLAHGALSEGTEVASVHADFFSPFSIPPQLFSRTALSSSNIMRAAYVILNFLLVALKR